MKPYFETNLGKLYHGSCEDILPRLNKKVDLTVTSPPYGDLRLYLKYKFKFENVADQLFKITKRNKIVVWIVGDTVTNGFEEGGCFKQALYFMQAGFGLYDTIIYQKNGMPNPGINRYYQCFEYMFVFSKGKPETTNLIADKKNKTSGAYIIPTERKKNGSLKLKKPVIVNQYGIRTNIWEYNIGYMCSTKDKIAHQHPAIFPEKLAHDHILSWSNKGDTVLDPMMGSGTVAKMCEFLGRKWIGCEIAEEYCEIAAKRIDGLKFGLQQAKKGKRKEGLLY
jgi:site-specific DNA-methyltransferase (adenine-specific)